jgi:hypothetical protein
MEPLLYNILLQADINDIANLCLVNKQTYNICCNKQFWVEKFNNNNIFIPVNRGTPQSWIYLFMYIKWLSVPQIPQEINDQCGYGMIVDDI